MLAFVFSTNGILSALIFNADLKWMAQKKIGQKDSREERADGFYDEVGRKENSAEKFFGKVGRRGDIT